ncbi:hypothetical protein FIV42_09575 [Persicimonas caeni]|uniref:Uncharacterized protein n=1 Tax=Persicimonas caeni TaxID=2292766 RepID=A0A4Y6PT72_PERCE|nr:hypothetical protein [Persicimonas caeni]QDG50975.1 hypothetical protein FIV42_09575 [Persicimonas caeni]QED32196.1 hypothetical protein FRD00_09570 [Persicimonas caeni]
MTVLKTIGWKTVLCVSCLALAGAWGCGDDNGGGGGGSNNGGSNNDGSSDTSSFSAQVETEGGNQQLEGEQADSKAGEGSWGASIADSNLQINLTSADGTAVTAMIATTESQKAPGDFTPQADIETTFVSIVSAAQGNAFMSTGSGTITLDSCPRAVGEHARGSFNNVVLAAESGNSTWTLDGSFDVVVYAKAGDLFCNEQSSSNNTSNNNTSNNNTQQCSADWCADGGVCCPYMQCMNSCELQCFQSADCQGGLNPQACAECANGCLDECDVSQECRTAAQALDTCSTNNGCDETADSDAEQQCLETNCCSEVNAAL